MQPVMLELLLLLLVTMVVQQKTAGTAVAEDAYGTAGVDHRGTDGLVLEVAIRVAVLAGQGAHAAVVTEVIYRRGHLE